MGSTRSIRVWCNECDVHVQDVLPLNVMLRTLKKQGWKRVRRNGKMVDMCPNCVHAYRQPSKENLRVATDLLHASAQQELSNLLESGKWDGVLEVLTWLEGLITRIGRCE